MSLHLSSPRRVGGVALDSFSQVKHEVPMLSLDNAFSEQEMMILIVALKAKNLESNQYLAYACEPKLDGVAVSLIYQNGVLVRGNKR